MIAPSATRPLSAGTFTRAPRAALAGLLALTLGCAGDGPAGLVAPDAEATTAVSAARKSGGRGPSACVPSANLIGRILLSTDDTPGTWWHLTRTGIDDAGLPGGYEAVIEGWFGQPFADEKAAVAFLVAQVKASDLNATRGARSSSSLPYVRTCMPVARAQPRMRVAEPRAIALARVRPERVRRPVARGQLGELLHHPGQVAVACGRLQAQRAGRDVRRTRLGRAPHQRLQVVAAVGDAGEHRHDVDAHVDAGGRQPRHRAQARLGRGRARLDAPGERAVERDQRDVHRERRALGRGAPARPRRAPRASSW
jgi:hypothetical protein